LGFSGKAESEGIQTDNAPGKKPCILHCLRAKQDDMKMDQTQDLSFEAERRDTPSLSALAAQMFDRAVRAQAGSRIMRPVSIHIDFTAREATGALQGSVIVTKSTASVVFLSAELTENGASVLRASAIYGSTER